MMTNKLDENGLLPCLIMARKRIEYLASLLSASDNGRHALSNEKDFFPKIDAAISRAQAEPIKVEVIEGLEEALEYGVMPLAKAYMSVFGDDNRRETKQAKKYLLAIEEAARAQLRLQQPTRDNMGE